ncbi:MAG: helix-turn-helix domain-containing protein [Firmicutes bacterium]|nr:helix-turn-helix domain-containing protein [Bacillota bacterium]
MKNHLRSAFNTRQHMLSEDFEVFYYSDLNFQSVGVHSHDYYEFYFFSEGSVSMEIEENAYPLKEGDLVVIPPGIRHRARVKDPSVPYRRFVLWISRDYVSELMRNSPDYVYLLQKTITTHTYVYHFDLISYNELRSRLFTLLDEIHQDRFGRLSRVELLIGDLLLCLNRMVYENDKSIHSEGTSLYQSLVQYIDAHLDEDLSLENLASAFYVSKFYIAHLFQETTGFSIHQYVIKKRLQIGRNLIRTGTPVTQAYLSSGFGDYSSFYRAFKKEYGLSPSEYQQQQNTQNRPLCK